MKRKLFWLLVAVTVFGASLGAAASTKISFWHTWSGEGGAAIEALVTSFEAAHPEIDVEIVLTTDLEQKLLTAVAGGASPDVVLFDRYKTGQFAARGALMALDSYIEARGINAADFFDAAWDETRYQGKSYGVPFYVDNKALLYNKRLFAEAGLDPNRPPETWEELMEYSKLLTKRDSEGYLTQVGFVPTWNWASLVHYIWQSNGDVFNEDMTKVVFNNEIGVNALEWVVEFIDMYGGNDALAAFSSGFGAQLSDPFYTGEVAMKSDGPWVYQDMRRYAPEFLENELGIAPLPRNERHATIAGGFSLIIPRGAKSPDASWQFIEYLLAEESQLAWALASGTIPAMREAAYAPEMMRDDFWRAFVENQENGEFRPVHPAFPEVESYIYQAVELAVTKNATPQGALDDAARRAQAVLDRYNRHIR